MNQARTGFKPRSMGPSRWCGGILWITLVESQANDQDVENQGGCVRESLRIPAAYCHILVHPVVITQDEATNKPWT